VRGPVAEGPATARTEEGGDGHDEASGGRSGRFEGEPRRGRLGGQGSPSPRTAAPRADADLPEIRVPQYHAQRVPRGVLELPNERRAGPGYWSWAVVGGVPRSARTPARWPTHFSTTCTGRWCWSGTTEVRLRASTDPPAARCRRVDVVRPDGEVPQIAAGASTSQLSGTARQSKPEKYSTRPRIRRSPGQRRPLIPGSSPARGGGRHRVPPRGSAG
jgi:hypothetical protein